MFRQLTAYGLSVAIVAVACGNSNSDGGGNAGTGGIAGNSGKTFGQSACGQCVSQACAAQRTACGGEPECASTLTCLEGCPAAALGLPEATCEAACGLPGSASAKAAYQGYSKCRASAKCVRCGTEEDGGGGASGVSKVLNQACGPSAKPNKCGKCLAEQCCETEAACNANPECSAAYQCWKTCPDATCLAECFTKHEGGVQLFLEENACPLALCATPEGCLPDPSPEIICDNQYCRELRVACSVMLDCYLMWECHVDCTVLPVNEQPACITQCDQGRSQEALDAYDAWGLCSLAKCP